MNIGRSELTAMRLKIVELERQLEAQREAIAPVMDWYTARRDMYDTDTDIVLLDMAHNKHVQRQKMDEIVRTFGNLNHAGA